MVMQVPDIYSIDQIAAHVFWYDTNHVLLGCNLSQAKRMGYTSGAQMAGRPLQELVEEPVLSNLIHHNNQVINTGRAITVQEGLVDKDGVLRYYITHKSPLFDEKNNVVGVLGVALQMPTNSLLNIPEKEHDQLLELLQRLGIERQSDSDGAGQVLRYLRDIKAYYENIIDLMPGNVYWVDEKGKVLGCNQNQALSIGKNSSSELVGENLQNLFAREEAENILQANKEVINDDKSIALEETSTMKGGIKKTYFSTKSPLKSSDHNVIGVLGVSLDITHRKKIELELIQQQKKAEAANQSKNEFILNMSHDLRTPCSGILGLAKILRDKEGDVLKREKLDHIVQSSEHLMELLSEIMDHTKVESSTYQLQVKSVNFINLVDSVVNLLSAEIQHKSLQLKVSITDKLPEAVLLDETVMHRVLLNLLSNAIKFTDTGSVQLLVEWHEQTQKLIVKVVDSGIGIDRSNHDIIFERFSRLSASYEGGYSGVGLGLATVKTLLDAIGGQIQVESSLGKGSCFTISVDAPVASPFVQQKPDRHEDVYILRQLCRHQEGFKRVLVVEDDLVSQKICKILLSGFQCQITVCDTGQSALDAFYHGFDLVFVDIGLPDMTGFDVAKAMRKIESKQFTKTPSVIFALTAHIDESYSALCIECGFDGLSLKPLTKDKLDLIWKQ